MTMNMPLAVSYTHLDVYKRQVFNIVASAVLVPLFYIELWLNPGMGSGVFQVPMVLGLMVKSGIPLKQQMAVAYLLFNLVAALIVIPLFGWLTKWLEKRYPEDAAEAAGRTQYLHPRATRDPVSCLGLIVDCLLYTSIRSQAILRRVCIITTLSGAKAALQGIKALRVKPVEVRSLQEYGKMLKG